MKLILGTHTVYTDYVYAFNLKNVLEYYNGYCLVVKQGYFSIFCNQWVLYKIFVLKYLIKSIKGMYCLQIKLQTFFRTLSQCCCTYFVPKVIVINMHFWKPKYLSSFGYIFNTSPNFGSPLIS